MESTLKNMILVLLVITAVAAVAVGGVYELTKGPIASAKQAKVNGAIAAVLPPFDNSPSAEGVFQTVDIDGGQVVVYPAYMGDALVGYAIRTFTNNGFGGQIQLMVGMLADGTINSIDVIEQRETPGLGDKIEASKSDFSAQFKGKNPADFKLSVRKDGGDVDAITASTISSRAYLDAVKRAVGVFAAVSNPDHDSASATGGGYDSVSGATSGSGDK